MIYLGAENIISPLGKDAKTNFNALVDNKTGLKKIDLEDRYGMKVVASVLDEVNTFDCHQQTINSINESLSHLDVESLKKGKTGLVLSTTKGEVTQLENGNVEGAKLTHLKSKIAQQFPWMSESLLVSNACISGVLSLIVAHDYIKNGHLDHVVVSGVDAVSHFTLAGFQSFFALSDKACKPFDKNRAGINLGEGVGTIVVSKDKSIFKKEAFELCGGTTANDANHISGPSRTGEGLFRTIQKSLKNTNTKATDIDLISAHGTGTNYNDEMESIAFERSGLNEKPLHSLKAYYGHTFGAAGMIETAICLQSMRENTLIPSKGFEEQGTSRSLNIIHKVKNQPIHTVLKTASGFGGCNASIIIKK